MKETISTEEVKGKWTQTVWEVADEPRYQGLSQFVNLDGKIIWQNTTDAEIDSRITAEINRFIGQDEKATAATH